MLGILTDAELRSMRKELAGSLGATATVYRAADTTVDGRTVSQYLPVSGLIDIRCDIEKPTGQTAGVVAEREVQTHDREIVFSDGTPVQAGDLVRTGPHTWEVIGTDADRTDSLALRCNVITDTGSRITP